MRSALIDLNIERKQNGQVELSQGIGVHFGSVIVGNIGTENRLEFTVIGDTVNLASRIESACKELKTDILISETVKTEIGNGDLTSDLGKITMKGKEDLVQVFGLL